MITIYVYGYCIYVLFFCLFFVMFKGVHFQELGLLTGTPVGTSLIDAHAGGVGVMNSLPDADFQSGLYNF